MLNPELPLCNCLSMGVVGQFGWAEVHYYLDMH